MTHTHAQLLKPFEFSHCVYPENQSLNCIEEWSRVSYLYRSSCVLSKVFLMRLANVKTHDHTHSHTHTVPVHGVLFGSLFFKVEEPATGRGGATLTWPGGLLQDCCHRDQGRGVWSHPTVCLSRSSKGQKEQISLDARLLLSFLHVLMFYLFFASVFFTLFCCISLFHLSHLILFYRWSSYHIIVRVDTLDGYIYSERNKLCLGFSNTIFWSECRHITL